MGTMTGVLGFLDNLSRETEVDNDVNEEILDQYQMVFRKKSVERKETDGNSTEENE